MGMKQIIENLKNEAKLKTWVERQEAVGNDPDDFGGINAPDAYDNGVSDGFILRSREILAFLDAEGSIEVDL